MLNASNYLRARQQSVELGQHRREKQQHQCGSTVEEQICPIPPIFDLAAIIYRKSNRAYSIRYLNVNFIKKIKTGVGLGDGNFAHL